jgi:hypothetical protein
MSAAALAALATFAASAAKADVVETFGLSGSLNSFFGSPVAFFGTIKLDFSNDFTQESLQSISITVQGRPVFSNAPSLNLAPWADQAVIGASNSSGDALTLMFSTPNPGAWVGFNQGAIAGGQVVYGGLTGLLLGAVGIVTRDPSDPAILAPPLILAPPPVLGPPVLDPPPITAAAAPEASTWVMMLIGLAGLGLAAKRRRALGSPIGRA